MIEVLQYQLPPKELNTGNLTLPFTIGNFNFYGMADLGASVNVMPRNIFEYLRLANLRNTNMLVEMADITKKAPLGRPFLATIHAKIKVFDKEISLGINNVGDRKKGHMLDKIWEYCKDVHKNNTYRWHDHGFEDEERDEMGIEIEKLSHPSQHYSVTWTLDYAVTSFKLARWKWPHSDNPFINQSTAVPRGDQGLHYSKNSTRSPREITLKLLLYLIVHKLLLSWFHRISFDYRVPLGFGSIAGSLDHGNPVIRLPVKHEISRVLGSDEKLTFNVESTLKYPHKHGDESINQIDIIDTTCEDHFYEVLNVQKSIHPLSGSPTPSDPAVASLSPSLTPFGDSDFLLEEIDAFLALDDSIPIEIDNGIYDLEGDIIFLEKLLNGNPTKDLPPKELKNDETKTTKSSIEEPPELELKDLPPHLEYAFLEGTSKLPEIIAKDLKKEEKDQLIKVSHVHVVPKKGGMTMVTNDNNELIPTRLVTGWHVCINYQKLNNDTRKDHFPIPFMDQMLERLAGNEFYCFLDGFSGYFQIPIDPQNQEKTTFTCPYGTFAYRRMPFGLCNASTTFQRCEDTNLVLNWEKCHFMVKEDIVLGHKISKNGIEVDRAKVDVISKLPPPTTVKGIRSFLGHAGFYRRFIQDFSKIVQPMTHLLEKETPFVFSKECMESFEYLKKKLTKAPILVAPDWDLPFEIMCDASDFAVGAVLGQRKNKYFQPIHYASKSLSDAQTHYTTTEKELLVVVYVFEKFWSYIVLSKTIEYTDHLALKYLFAKQDAKPRLH
ncbi:reverse transcriptase domain-containing protein [Tanacetum coccineum]